MNDEPEEWRQIADFPDYSVSNYSRIRRDKASTLLNGYAKPGRILNGEEGAHGHLRVTLFLNGKAHRRLVYRLAAIAFLPQPRADQVEIAHCDGNPRNNHISNLRWATRRENAQDTIAHGTVLRGSKNGKALFTEDDVRRIKKLRASGTSNKALAAEYGVSKCTISSIWVGRNWRHVA